jgi:hypothetical protein
MEMMSVDCNRTWHSSSRKPYFTLQRLPGIAPQLERLIGRNEWLDIRERVLQERIQKYCALSFRLTLATLLNTFQPSSLKTSLTL